MSDNLKNTEKNYFRNFILEIIFILIFGIFVFLLTRNLNLYESLHEYHSRLEYLNLDELFFTFLFVIGVICFLGVRRYFELKREINNSFLIQKELEEVVREKNKIEESLRLQESYSQEILSLVKKLEYTQTNSELLSVVKKSIAKVLGYRTIWFYKISDDKKYAHLIFDGIIPRSMKQQDFIRIDINSSPYYQRITTQKKIDIVDDALNDTELSNKKFIRDLQIHTLVHMPLLMHDEPIGLLGTGSFGSQGIRVPTQEQLDFIISLSGHVALVLDRIQLQQLQLEAKLALKKSEENYRLLIEQSAQAIYLQENGKYVIVNDNFLNIFGITQEDVSSEDFSLLNYTHPNSMALLK